MTEAPNATIEAFGYPDNVIREYNDWVVMYRPKQVTLGCLVVVCKEDAERLPDISIDAFAELQQVTRELESTLKQQFEFDKINYLMLMMSDPNVHWHVIPRYAGEREIVGIKFNDSGWSKPPNLADVKELTGAEAAAIRKKIRDNWVELPIPTDF